MNGFGVRRWIGIACVALVVALAGCGAQETPKTVEVTKPPSPRKVILASVHTTVAAQSARISFSTTTSRFGEDALAGTADGVFDFATGDSQLTMHFGGAGADLFSGEIRTVDGAAYMQLPELFGDVLPMPGGAKWLKISDFGELGTQLPGVGQGDPSQFLASLEAVSNGVIEIGGEMIRGVETTHYKAILDLAKTLDGADVPASLRDLLRGLAESVGSGTIPVDVWVDGSGLLRRIELRIVIDPDALMDEAPGSATGAGDAAPVVTTLSLDMYDFGVPVHIVAPPADQVTSFADALRGLNSSVPHPELGRLQG